MFVCVNTGGGGLAGGSDDLVVVVAVFVVAPVPPPAQGGGFDCKSGTAQREGVQAYLQRNGGFIFLKKWNLERVQAAQMAYARRD